MIEMDNEILDDFIIEAGEILEQLSEQLVELERSPNDSDILNAIFRGFHTVKGGSGFLGLTAMVECCHGAENIFDVMRNHQRTLTPELMDVILSALDAVNNMFDELQSGSELTPATPELIEQLHRYSKPESNDEAVAEVQPVAQEKPVIESEPVDPNANIGINNITESKFALLLNSLGSASEVSQANEPKADAFGDELITDDEFEKLLDELHGEGNGPVSKGEAAAPLALSPDDELITDDEFEKLLDELHGEGNGPVSKGEAPKPPAPKKVAPAPKPPAPKKAADTTVRVETSTLDDIMNMVGELVLVRNRLIALDGAINNEEVSKTISGLDLVTADLQSAVMKTRMQPIKKVFGRFPRVVRDLARSLNKKIELTLVGEETDLDKNLVEALADPLVHLVRNSVDHGIEMPADRIAKGKQETGSVILSASQEGDHILLAIQDDGAGMDPEKLKSIAIDRGILDEEAAARMTDEAAYQLIFEPGFSTKTEISDISGRGVGMDVVKTSLTKLSGTITVKSELGKGSIIEIKVPLTLAILPALMVGVMEKTFALPLTNVKEIINLQSSEISVVDGRHTVYVRNKPIQLFYLEDWLCNCKDNVNSTQNRHVIIVQYGSNTVGFVVSNLIGQEEVVIKPLDGLLKGTPGLAGATITSDGDIALIVDIPVLIEHYA